MSSDHHNQVSALLEKAVSAFRSRTPDGRIRFAPEWYDLGRDEREDLFHLQVESRIIERAIDPDGLSSTARAVLARCKRLRQMRH